MIQPDSAWASHLRLLKVRSQHTNWHKLNTDLQRVDPVERRVHWSRASASRLDWLHAAKLGRLVLSQFVRREHSHWQAGVSRTLDRELQSSSVYVLWPNLLYPIHTADAIDATEQNSFVESRELCIAYRRSLQKDQDRQPT